MREICGQEDGRGIKKLGGELNDDPICELNSEPILELNKWLIVDEKLSLSSPNFDGEIA